MLEVALADPLGPGTNPRADVVSSSWLLLLPDLRPARVAFEGRVDEAIRAAVVAAARSIAPAGGRPDGTASLVVAGPGAAPARVAAWRAADGAVYLLPGVDAFEVGTGRAVRLAAGTAPGWDPAGPGPSAIAVPFVPRDPAAAGRTRARVGRVLARAGRKVGVSIGQLPGPERSGVVVVPGDLRPPGTAVLWRGDPAPAEQLPAWLLDMAAAAGRDLRAHRFRFLPGGDYWAQKAVFLTYPSGADAPDLAVKVARAPAFSGRLVTERDALELLARRPDPLEAVIPEVAFWGESGGITVLGQSAVPGEPMARALVPSGPCPATRLVSDALLDLAAGGSQPEISAPEAAAVFAAVVARFAAAHPDRALERAALDRAVDRIAASDDPFPVVFHHGDAGVWNVVLTPDGRAGLLDWENAEPGGVPLWDLWYLHQTRGSSLAAAAGRRATPRGFARDLLRPSPARELLAADLRRWRERLGISESLVEPLFLLCWAHHAAKEASRSPSGPQRRRGRYVRILGEVVAAGPTW